MEQALIALVSVLAALVGAFIWFLKFIARKMFGKEGTDDRGVIGDLAKELVKNTDELRGMKEAQKESNIVLKDLLEATRS